MIGLNEKSIEDERMITDNERKVLLHIINDEYQEINGWTKEAKGSDVIDFHIWGLISENIFSGCPKKLGGVMSSLVKKGLAVTWPETYKGENDAGCYITAKGFAAIEKYTHEIETYL